MNPLKVFSNVNLGWLIRHYIFGIIILSFFYFALPTHNFYLFFTLIINLIFFPFACFVWEELKNMLLGDNVFIVNAIFLLLSKIIIKLILFMLAIPIGIIGFLILWFIINKKQEL
ncbi:hypothetical protein I6R12_000748 [Campylobacter coli]|nr:hypothetical protein [Campylobacter coli]EGS1371368.1 hypothetical protein [Campylobacter coli]